MRLCRVKIENFKSIENIEFQIPFTAQGTPGSADFLSIVGKNNAGKSTILQAIQAACPGVGPFPIEYFPHCQIVEGKYPTVELHFEDITQADREHQAVGPHVISDQFIIRKQWRRDRQAPQCWVFKPLFTFRPDPSEFRTLGEMRKDALWCQVLRQYEARNGEPKPDKTRLSEGLREELKQLAIDIGAAVAHQGDPDWQLNPGGFAANLESVLPEVIFIPAIQPSKDVADSSKKNTAFARIVRRIFESSLAGNDAVTTFHEAAKSLEAIFHGESRDEMVESIENNIRDRIRELIDLKPSLSFVPPDLAVSFVSSTELRFSDANTEAPVTAEHHGHGAQRAIILSLLKVMSEIDDFGTKPLLFLIEEPEIYLHPEMCRKMRDSLVRIARTPNAQVICTTHSPTFIDIADRHDGVLILRRDSGTLQFHQSTTDLFSGADASDQRRRLRMILNFDASVNEVFFSDHVALVEGDTEIAALDAIGRKLCDDGEVDETEYLSRRRALKIVNCRGKWTIESFQRVLGAFNIRYVVVHDEDGLKPEAARANPRILALLDGDESRRRVHRPNFEEQYFGEELAKDKPWEAHKRILAKKKLPRELRSYFEFMLNCPISDLQPKQRNSGATSRRGGRLRNRRQLPTVEIDAAALVPCSIAEFLNEPGTAFAAVDSLQGSSYRYQSDEHGPVLVTSSTGDMSPVAKDSWIVIKKECFTLQRRADSSRPLSLQEFRRQIPNQTIHIVALNDKIVSGHYCIRRVLTEMVAEGGWNCRITTDQPIPGEEFDKVIRKFERAHFLAEVIAVAEMSSGSILPTSPVPGGQEVVHQEAIVANAE